jgi:hypothetical protein
MAVVVRVALATKAAAVLGSPKGIVQHLANPQATVRRLLNRQGAGSVVASPKAIAPQDKMTNAGLRVRVFRSTNPQNKNAAQTARRFRKPWVWD